MTGRLTVYRQQTHLRKSCVVFLRPFFKTILGLVVRHLGWVDFVSVISLSAQFCFGRWKLDIIGWAATVWGGRLSKRFSNMFPESSTVSWAELQLPCCPSKQGELPENMAQNLLLNLPPHPVGNMVEHPNQGQPNPCFRPPAPLCIWSRVLVTLAGPAK